MEFMSVRDAASLWNLSERRVQKYCKDNRIEGVRRFGRSWMIPGDAIKPADPRKGCLKGKGEQINQVRTIALFKRLFKTSSIKEFVEKNADEMQLQSFSEYITGLCEKKGEVPERIIKRSNIERSFGHQLFKGKKKPSRDTVLQLAFGFEADMDTVQELLKHAGMSALYPRVKRDTAILYCLHNRFSIVETQNVLHEMGLPLIGGGKRE